MNEEDRNVSVFLASLVAKWQEEQYLSSPDIFSKKCKNFVELLPVYG